MTNRMLLSMEAQCRPKAVMLTALAVSVAAFAAFWPDMAFAQDAHTQVFLDPTFRTPPPPNDTFLQNAEHVFVATSVMLAIALIFLVVSIFDSRRFKSTVPVAMVFGAAFCVVPEAIDNYLAGCYWSQSHDPDKLLFFLMGREFDYYIGIM